MPFVASHLMVLLALAVVIGCAGLPWTRLLGQSVAVERLAWAGPLGLATLGHVLFGLALGGWLNRGTVAAVGIAALVAGGRDALRLVGGLAEVWRAQSGRRRALALVLVLGLVPLVLAALYPPQAWDETIYHLPMARAFANTGAMPFLSHLRVPVFPALAELLDAGVLLFADDVAPHGFALLATLAVAALLVDLARTARATDAGWIAAAIHLGTPMVIYLSGVSYVEPLLTLFATAALGAGARAIATRSRRWLVVAGAFAGSAAAVKYLALVIVGWLAFELCVRWSGGLKARARAVGWYGLAVAATAIPTYARILWWTGNPLFPFYSTMFGTHLWDFEPANFHVTAFERLRGAALLAWHGVFARDLVGALPPLSPFWLIAAAALVAGIRRQRSVAWTAALAAAYALSIPAHARYLLPIVPVVGLLGAMVLTGGRQLSRRSILFVCLGLLLPGLLYASALCVRRGALPTTPAARRAFLLGAVPGYATVDFLNQRAGPNYAAYGLHLERMMGYAAGDWMGDWSGPARFDRIVPLLSDRPELEQELRALGAGYFAAPRSALPSGFTVGPRASAIFDRDGFVVFALDAAAEASR